MQNSKNSNQPQNIYDQQNMDYPNGAEAAMPQRSTSQQKQVQLQRRLFEIGQGQLHGKTGLPGVQGAPKGSQSNQIPSQSLGILRAGSRSTKLLIPSNQPFRVKVPQKIEKAQLPMMKSTFRTGSQAKNAGNILVDDDEVQHLPMDAPMDTLADQVRQTERVQPRRSASKLLLQPLQHNVAGNQLSSQTPKIMTLGQMQKSTGMLQSLSTLDAAKMPLSGEDHGRMKITARGSTPNKMTMQTGTLPISRSVKELPSLKPSQQATNEFLNAAISSSDILQTQIDRDKTNPQFQRLNMAPYSKESRQFVNSRRSVQRASLNSLVLSDIAEKAKVSQRFGSVFDQRAAKESKEKAAAHNVESSQQKSQAGLHQRIPPSQATKPTAGPALSQSKTIVSQITGLHTVTPLGPSIGSVRSISRTRIEQAAHLNHAKRDLSRQTAINVQSQQAVRKNEEEMQASTQNSQGKPLTSHSGQNSSMKATLQAIQNASKGIHHMSKQEYDERMRRMRLKLQAEAKQQRNYVEFMHSVQPSNSRQNVIPGQTDIQQEALRSQLLIGKLKTNEHLPSIERLRGQAKEHVVDIGKGIVAAPAEISEASSREIPAICSDQVSAMSFTSSELQNRNDAGLADDYKDHDADHGNVITKLQSRRQLGKQMKKDVDYKPHDHQNLEDSPMAKQYGLGNTLKRQDHKLQRQLPGVTFQDNLAADDEVQKHQNLEAASQKVPKRNSMTQPSLEQLIQGIQNSTGHEEGYFIYLRQSEQSLNPYDLIPVMRNQGQGANERPGSRNRARDNLSAVERAKKPKIIIKKPFKSQYHQEKKEFKFRQSYEGAPVTQKQKNEAANQVKSGQDKYYTLSKKGMTTFKNGEPDEFTKIEDWLAERAQFNQISQKKFFKKFRIWKIIRMWRRHIVAARREDAQANLRQKLFHADHIFGHILLDHRYACKDIEKYRVVDVSLAKGEPYDLASFRARQAEVRANVANQIAKTSNLTRENFLKGINYTLDKLREKIAKQEEADQKDDLARKMDSMQPGSNQTKAQGDFPLAKMLEKMASAGPVYEQLGFKHNMKFGARSELRDACKKFLRFAFLLDFVALESLSNVYLLSIQDCQAKLKLQVAQKITYDLIDPNKIEQPVAQPSTANNTHSKHDKLNQEADDNAIGGGGGLQQPEIPLFVASCEYKEYNLDESDFVDVLVDPFVLPPLGRSTKKDFNPMVHLEIEPEKADQDEEESNKGYNPIEEPDSDDEKLLLKRPDGLSKKWLDITPNKKELSVLLNDAFQLGFDSLKSFEQWANNAELKPYDSVLEPWDYRSYEKWDPPTEESDKYLDCGEWLQGESDYIHLEENIDRRLNQAMLKVEEQFYMFESLLQLYWSNKQLQDFRIVAHERLKNPTDVLPILLERLKDQGEEFSNSIPVDKDLGLLRVNFDNVRKVLTPQPKACIKKLEVILPKMVKKRIEKCKIWMQEQISALRKQPEDVDSFVTQIQCLEYIEDNYQEQRDLVELNDQIFRICERFDLPTREDRQSRFIDEVYQLMSTLNNAIYETKDTADKRKDIIKRQILKEIPALNERVELITEEILHENFLQIDVRPLEENLIALEDLETRFSDIAYKKKKVQLYQRTMDMGNIEPFNNVEDTKALLQQRVKLWKSISNWTKNVQIWQISPFEEIDVNYILEQATLQAKIVLQCERNLPSGSSAVQHLKKLVFEFKETMPIVEALGNKYLQEIHWNEIKEKLEIGDFPLEEKQFSLGELVDLNVAERADEVVNISITATQENHLRTQLQGLAERWRTTDFELAQYKDKDVMILINIDKVQSVLDESMQICSAINGSRYVKRLQQQAQDEQDRLNLIFDTLEQWRECQRNWMYLESIFSSGEDIRKHRHKDASDFDTIDKSWTKLMKDTYKQRSVRRQCVRQRLNDLSRWNLIMERIQKSLEEYLEEKREQFPRFYFISNEELLRIMASSSDLRGIEKHATKCFENMKEFILQSDLEGVNEEDLQNNDLSDIYGVKSLETERLMFGKRILKTRGNGVEQWMRSFEEYMMTALQKEIKEAHKRCTDENVEFDRKTWVLSHLSQAVAVVGQVTWTEGTELALNDLFDENPFAIEEYLEIIKQQLQQLTELIRGQLTGIERKTLVAIITQDVHSRDIIEQMHQDGVQSPFDFQWQKQLRYYLDEDSALVYIRQANAHINYGYEYLGPTSRLVITPLTDKCWLTITGAMHIKLGAAPAGPAGTGKTESTKDLAKACGVFCIVINCSDQIEYRMMAKLFSGLVQSGSWTCLDEFNRINIEVLSVIAQQLLDIKQAKLQGKDTFMFNEKERELKQSCGVYITMNPGYAGRTELPDNLKVLFRPVSMMIPAYGLIAEIMLFAEGFGEARALSKKMVQLYKLASEQLSQQDHYDFGLRAVKSVLVMAGNLKRSNPELPESIVLIRAMRDSNIPKFLADDLPLFSALIEDLFPGIEIPTTQHKELERQVNSTLKKMNFQQVEKLNLKVIQLFETLNVRFGVMIVGPTGGGKTTTFKVLAESMSKLREKKSKDQRFQNVKYRILNPKSITMGELYGEEDADTQEWSDGLASKILRKFAQPQKDPERKNWTVFDGPVDALWIENMNTVLDDNMTLSLVNGERIKLNFNMRILFEVQDLAQASPATVSRCGMLYLTPSDLGWRPYFDSWKQKYIKNLITAEQLAFLDDLFERFVDLAFERIQKLKGDEIMPTIPLQNVQCLCNFIEHFINTPKLQSEERKDQWQKQINAIFAFSMIWGFGAAFDQPIHRYLDNIFREFFSKLQIPNKDSVFQYFFHEKDHKFYHWKELINDYEKRIEYPYDQLFVPTVDSVSYTKILQYLIDLDKKTFFTGATGVGKSIIAQEFIKQNQESQNYAPIMLNFSAQTSATSVQRSIESKLIKKRGKKVIGASGSQQCLIFIDDINMPLVEQYGAQPPIEFLRLLVDADIIYDKPAYFKKQIERYKMICAAAPPGGGRAALTPRFMRHFHIINIPTASEEILTYIFETIIDVFLSENLFPDDVRKCGNIAVASTIDMFTQFNKNMLPIPSRFHYLFNLRDVSRVMQGVLMTRPQSIQNSKVFTRLWLHECQRIFHDRLIDEGDRQYFRSLVMELLQTKFKEKWSEDELFVTNFDDNRLKVTFTMIMKCDQDEKLYEEVRDLKKLVKLLEDKTLDYNFSFTQSQMDLIFFEDAIDHICRITRVLNQPRGNAMLIGVSGGGKQSLTKLAAFLIEAPCSSIKLQKNYRPANFREDFKVALLDSGCKRRPNVFLLADTQIIHEQFLEDVNSILNTGEIADLYEKEDTDQMAESLEKFMREQRIPPSADNIYETFIKQLKLNLHIILCMSPVGNLLRDRCRNFPSLVNCCTLDWFDNWPEQALKTVSEQFFTSNQMLSDNESLRNGVISMFPKVHRSVEHLASQFFEEQKRHVYITPKSYLDALGLFRDLLIAKQIEIKQSYDRLNNGITKLETTNEQIKELRVTLTELAPKLQEEKESAGAQVDIIQEQSTIAREKEAETENEARKVQHEAKQIGKVKEEAETKLKAARPALIAAEKAVNELSRDDINELKQVKSPPAAVEPALHATLIYLGYNKYDWPTAQKAMADMRFLDRLKNYDRENVPDNIYNKVTQLIKKAAFDIDKIEKASKAAGGLAKWCKAVREYSEALKVVRPLQERLAVMSEKFQEAEEVCRQKQLEVDAIKAQLQQLQDDYQGTLDLIEKLNQDKVTCEKRLVNASKLLALLGSEGERWKEEIALIRERMSKFVGDVFVSSSQMSYLGPFTGQYREPLIMKWIEQSKNTNIQLSDDYSLIQTLGDPIEIRRWGINGLPSDQVSTENAIFTTKSQRWPMLIDPQFQANAWIKKLYRQNEGHEKTFAVNKISNSKEELPSSGKTQNTQFAQFLENAVRFGKTLLLEDMPEEIDPSIEAIVSKQIYRADGILKINLGSNAVDYHEDFKLYMTTKLSNPHFLPEVTIKVAVINFTVTFDGLDDQLLAEAVKNLEPELEKQRDKLVIEISSIKNEQYLMQSSILNSLAESNQDTILDNEMLIETLAISKQKSKEIAVSLKKSELVGKTVSEKREQYRDVSVRGSVLYFVIASLSSVDPMYQNSLAYVKKKFNETIRRIIGFEETLSYDQENEASEHEVDITNEQVIDQDQDQESKKSQRTDGRSNSEQINDQVRSSEQQVQETENADKTQMEMEQSSQAQESPVNYENGSQQSVQQDEMSSIQQLDPEQIKQLNAELISNITQNLYINVCRGLFEAHKIIFSFMICTSIKKNISEIDEVSYNILLRGQGVYDKSQQPEYKEFPAVHDFITKQQWDLAYCIQLKVNQYFPNLLEDLLVNHEEWRQIANQEVKENDNSFDVIPKRFLDAMPLFFSLLLIKLIRPQQLVGALKDYVVYTLGREYATSPLTSMDDLFASADKVTPVIFVLSQGADPNEQILQHAKKVGFTNKLFQKSLGQGQERAATNLIREGSSKGEWILLQNCHLFKSWMPQLEAICSDLRENSKGIHRDFRLILTSMPVDYFPASILQNGVKMTTEPPQGLKANMKRIMSQVINKEVYALAEIDHPKNQQQQAELAQAQQSKVSFSQESGERSSTGRLQQKVVQQPNSIMPDFERQFDLDKCWKALLYGLSFFHSIIQERKKFGSLGWNIRYEFNDSDLETSVKMLQNFLFESEEIPWDSMQFMTGHINYGGRVTDDIDRILLICLLKKCYGEHILEPGLIFNAPVTAKKRGPRRKKQIQSEFFFFGNPNYKIPSDNDTLDGVQKYIDNLPNIDEPEICGMHKNASISYQLLAGESILRTIINIQLQPVVSKRNQSADGSSRQMDNQPIDQKSQSAPSHSQKADDDDNEEQKEDDSKLSAQDKQVIEIADALYENRPLPISIEERSKEIFKEVNGLRHCFSIVLLQEQERYNKLINVIHQSLELLIKAIQGIVLMSADLDQMYGALLKNQVPANWQAVSYSSQKQLASWFKDLHKRVEFMRKWMMKGHPSAFWLSGFFFPHGFMTGILQTYARKHRKAIDFLKFKFDFLDGKELEEFVTKDGTDYQNIEELDRILPAPQDGAYIYGLYIESARWCSKTHKLQEQAPGIVMQTMPIIHFLPYEVRHVVPKKLVPEKKADDNEQANKLEKPDADNKGENDKKKKSPSRRRIKEGPPVPKQADVYAGEEDTDISNPALYQCPVYKTSSRAGALSTTGQSTNYILSVYAPIDVNDGADHWTLRGTAMLTMHDF